MPEYSDDDQMSLVSGIAAFESREFAKALRMLTPFAERGDAEALYRCAIMMQNGLGMVKNELQGYKCMREAAQLDHALAQHGLAFMYMEGDCVEQSGDKAVEWFEKAANQGMLGSMTTLAMLYEQGHLIDQNAEKARHWYNEAGFSDKADELS